MSNNVNLIKAKFYVGLGSIIDFSKWESFSRNVRMDELERPKGLVYFEVDSLKEASNLTLKFIREFNLAASNWIGGIVLDSSMKFVANISYNGRVWDNENWQDAKEIELC